MLGPARDPPDVMDPWGTAAAAAAGGDAGNNNNRSSNAAMNNDNNINNDNLPLRNNAADALYFNNNNNNAATAALVWRERERRQRTVRVLMMFLLMLLLMDGEEQNQMQQQQQRNRNSGKRKGLRGNGGSSKHSGKNGSGQGPLEAAVFVARQRQDAVTRQWGLQHARYAALMTKNGGRDAVAEITAWAEQQQALEKDQFEQSLSSSGRGDKLEIIDQPEEEDANAASRAQGAAAASSGGAVASSATDGSNAEVAEAARKVWHYPTNATGFYRGQWTRVVSNDEDNEGHNSVGKTAKPSAQTAPESRSSVSPRNKQPSSDLPPPALPAPALEEALLELLQEKHEAEAAAASNGALTETLLWKDTSSNAMMLSPRVVILPRHQRIQVRDDHNLTSMAWERMTMDAAGRLYAAPPLLPGGTETPQSTSSSSGLRLFDAEGTSAATAAQATAGDNEKSSKDKIPLSRDAGRAAFQLYSRAVPALHSLSIVDGFVKLYDAQRAGYSTRKDVLLRVRGVLLHDTGVMSLVSNVDVARSALVMPPINSGRNSNTNKEKHEDHTVQQLDYSRQATRRLVDKQGGNGEASSLGEEQEEDPEPASLTWLAEKETLDSVIALDKETSSPRTGNSVNASVPSSSEVPASKQEDHSEAEVLDPAEQQDSQSGNVEEGEKSKDESPKLEKESSIAQEQRHRRLQSTLGDQTLHHDAAAMEQLRQDALELYGDSVSREKYDWAVTSPEWKQPQLPEKMIEDERRPLHRRLLEAPHFFGKSASKARNKEDDKDKKDHSPSKVELPPWSDIVLPYPFVRDDADESFRKFRTPAARRMPTREQALEANAADCEFELLLHAQEVEWTVGAWRHLMLRQAAETKRLDPTWQQEQQQAQGELDVSGDGQIRPGAVAASMVPPAADNRRARRQQQQQYQALVMTLSGSISSPNCGFAATLNATALRTDWEATTSKAINYSFYMMLVCLTQIIILLRQLLHSQAQAAATRVSMICIGWQTVGDALLCLAHIYLSLAMQPLFTAFASVAFFKLLIFCVIEMKYMAIIIQAHNSAAGGRPTDVLRRQVAILHLRIYVAMFGTFLLLFYVGDSYRTLYVLGLYSFWWPQIILNVVTEAKTPLHKYYIYGMSLTRLVAPIYVFAIRNNFLKEVYPEAPYDPWLCQWLVLWVGFQTAILIGQGKYGARFMIPARFLPPKFDYSRPIPASMLPPGALDMHQQQQHASQPSDHFHREPADDHPHHDSLRNGSHTTSSRTTTSSGRHTTSASRRKPHRRAKQDAMTIEQPLQPSTGLRHGSSRHGSSSLHGKSARGSNGVSSSSLMRSAAPPLPPPAPAPTLDCSICYECIDVLDRSGYMLAPCNHLFHKNCLEQWMNVKMECPICRTDLPAL